MKKRLIKTLNFCFILILSLVSTCIGNIYSDNNGPLKIELKGLRGGSGVLPGDVDPREPIDPTIPINPQPNYDVLKSFNPKKNKSRDYEGKLDIPFFYNTKYTYNYFSNLTDFRLTNFHGSCGYVAITMLLTFYDSYWNDDFIPEVYDQSVTVEDTIDSNFEESPGIKDILYGNELELSSEEYINNIYENRAIDFRGYLVSLGLKNFINYRDFFENETYQPLDTLTKNNSLSMESNEIESLITQYLIDRGFEKYFTSFIKRYYKEVGHDALVEDKEKVDRLNLENWDEIKEIVSLGIPVIVQVNNSIAVSDDQTHYLIVFAYDDRGFFYGNMGNTTYDSCVLIHPHANYLSSASYIVLINETFCNMSKNDNYILKNNTRSINASDISSHLHNPYFVNKGVEEHLVLCSCEGYYQRHFYDVKIEDSLKKCLACGHEKVSGGTSND